MTKSGWLYWLSPLKQQWPILLNYEPQKNSDTAHQKIVYHDDDSGLQEFGRVAEGLNAYVRMLVPGNTPAQAAIASMLLQLRNVAFGNQRPCEQCGIQIPPGFETEAGNGMVFCSGQCYGACVGVPATGGRDWIR